MLNRWAANPYKIQMWSQRNKCFMCKHKFTKPFILPVVEPVTGKFHPNFNVDVQLHLMDTHGIPDTVSRRWIVGDIYGLELNEFGAKGLEGLFDE